MTTDWEYSKRLRSAAWSSETLAAGMRTVSGQPSGLLVKQEGVDEALFAEYQAACLVSNGRSSKPRHWKRKQPGPLRVERWVSLKSQHLCVTLLLPRLGLEVSPSHMSSKGTSHR